MLIWVAFLGCECCSQAVLVAEKMSSSKPESSISSGSAGESWGTATPDGLSGLCSASALPTRELKAVLYTQFWPLGCAAGSLGA